MFRKTKRFVRMYPVFSIVLFLGILALVLDNINKHGLAAFLFVVAVLLATVPASATLHRTLKHGFFGIHLLPLTAAIFALFLRDFQTALMLAVLLNIEKPLLAHLQHRQKSEGIKAATLTTVSHAPFVRLLDRFCVPFIVLVILIGGAVWVISGDSKRFLEVTAVASTAPLLLAAPVAMMSGMNRSARRGIVLTSAAAFERLSYMTTLVLSKAGTLTSTDVNVKGVHPYGKHTKSDVLRVAAALASQSEHYLARAIVIAAGEASKVHRAKHAQEIPGLGITGRMRGRSMHIGRLSFLEDKGVDIPAKPLSESSDPVVYVAEGDTLIGSITFSDLFLPGAKTLAQKLKKLGVKTVYLVSGSTKTSIAAVAKQAGIVDYKGNTNAATIIGIIESSKSRPVAFVGDSVADAPALTAADVAITRGEASPGLSDVALHDYSPVKLIEALTISKHTMSRAKLISMFGLFVTLALVVGAVSGKLQPIACASLNLLVSIATIMLAYSSSAKDKTIKP